MNNVGSVCPRRSTATFGSTPLAIKVAAAWRMRVFHDGVVGELRDGRHTDAAVALSGQPGGPEPFPVDGEEHGPGILGESSSGRASRR